VEETFFLDDYPKYIKGYIDLGGPCALVNPKPESWAEVPEIPHIDKIYGLANIINLTAD
jgi:hypothetical protein